VQDTNKKAPVETRAGGSVIPLSLLTAPKNYFSVSSEIVKVQTVFGRGKDSLGNKEAPVETRADGLNIKNHS